MVEAADGWIQRHVSTLPEKLDALCQFVITNEHFRNAPAAERHHHNYRGGLIQHTAEVVCNVGNLGISLRADQRQVLIVAAVWHDFMKVADYSIAEDGAITKTPYYTLINHVAGSFAAFHHRAIIAGVPKEIIDRVSHCLLSHHGRKEWGSPVEPQTAEAHILHCADLMSSQGIVL